MMQHLEALEIDFSAIVKYYYCYITYVDAVQTDIDFAKAFAIVPHKHILYKLKWFGI